MNSATGKITIAIFDRAVCLKVSGKTNFASCVDLKKVVTGLHHSGHQRFVFDLSECVIMDSTFLGTLAGFGLKFAPTHGETDGKGVELLNPNPRIQGLLENLGVAHLFTIVQDATPSVSTPFSALKCTTTDRKEIAQNCLEAHQILMGICPENVQKFKDVAQFLAEDLQRIEAVKVAAPK